jgi:hypothetical protein
VAYEDMGCNSSNSMHGPAVASLLAGSKTGTAPDVKIYYAAVPSWLGDSAYYAKALDWVISQNRTRPEAERIRVVSVSAAPSGKGSPFTKNTALWDEAVARAEAAGMLVLDCTEERGIVGSCWFRGGDRGLPSACVPGYPGVPARPDTKQVLAPTSPRTSAEQYADSDYGYVYWGRGGLSWAVPYVAGVLALGWQVRPQMSAAEAKELLLRTAEPVEGGRIIHPEKFVGGK